MEEEPDFQGMETVSFFWEYWVWVVVIINNKKLADKITAEKMQHSTIGEETAEVPGGTEGLLFGVRGTGETKVRGEDGVC